MADFSTWQRATLEKFAQEATDKMRELEALVEQITAARGQRAA